MIHEQSAKRPKLDAVQDEHKEKSRIPDDVLFTMFSFLSIRDRMRLSLVSKRFRQLIHFDPKRIVWKDIDTLSLTLEERKIERTTAINGHEFNTRRRANALQLFLDYCAPFKQVEISANLDTAVDEPWLKNIFLRYLMEAQNRAGKGPPPELIFRGSLLYGPAVFDTLVDEQTTKIGIEIGSRKQNDGYRLDNLENVWSKVAACDSLTEFHFGSNDIFLFVFSGRKAVAALSGKESLRELTLKMADRSDEFIHSFSQIVADIANSCPSLSVLICGAQIWSGILLIDFLAPATRERLQELTICGEPDDDFMLGPDKCNILTNQFTALTKLSLNLENAAPFIEVFLTEHQLEDKILYMDLDLSCGTWVFELTRAALLERLESVCDGLAMAPQGRFAFVKGFALVSCKIVEEKWPDKNLK